MKKVRIITKHSSYNFGAMLQAYALQKVVSGLGTKCKIIDLRQPKPQTKWSWFSPRGIINNLAYKIHKKEIQQGFLKFENFIDDLDKTERYDDQYSLYDNPPQADVYLSGSDQVWNPLKVSEAFFLRFAPKGSIRASYAASLGVDYLPEGTRRLVKEYLNDFDYISVREQDGKEIIEDLTEKEVDVNLDPTLLLREDEWKEVGVEPTIKRPYILCYVLYRPKWLNKWLKKVKSITKKEIVLVTTNAFRNVYNDKVVRCAGPKEFLGLIQGADFVISSSFHGVALSIATRKPFYAVINPNMPSRINNLLSLTNLEDRIVNEKEKFSFSNIDYSKVEKILNIEREKSLDYLKSLLTAEKKESSRKQEETTRNIEVVGNKCTACTVCKNVCPTNAISIKYNSEGFLYPSIDKEKCVNCGLCAKKCHVLVDHKNTKETCDVFYGWNKDENIRINSSSGGVFSAIADRVLEDNGIVFGAYFDEQEKKVLHSNTDKIDLCRIRSSKYVESEMGDTLEEIDKALKKGRKVLFCGTPCQSAGVREKFNDENLLICDFLCHGVPSAKLFKDMLLGLEKEKRSELIDYKFRTKYFGWSQYGVKAKFKKGKEINSVGRCDWFYKACMVDNLFLRESCYTCDKNVYHSSDLTIGDFWGVSNYKSEINDQKGISVILVNTEKGRKVLEMLSEKCEIFSAPKKYIDYALNVKTGDKKLREREFHFREYNSLGTKRYVKKYYAKKLFVSKLSFNLRKRKLKKWGIK